MKIIKKVYPRQFKDEKGNIVTKNLPMYFIKEGDYKLVAIRPIFEEDWGILNYLAEYVKTEAK